MISPVLSTQKCCSYSKKDYVSTHSKSKNLLRVWQFLERVWNQLTRGGVIQVEKNFVPMDSVSVQWCAVNSGRSIAARRRTAQVDSSARNALALTTRHYSAPHGTVKSFHRIPERDLQLIILLWANNIIILILKHFCSPCQNCMFSYI